MNERRAVLAADCRNVSSSGTIDRPGRLGLAFRAVDSCIGGEIDDQIGSFPSDHCTDNRRLGDVGCVPIKGHEIEGRGPSGAANLTANLPPGPEYQDSQKCPLGKGAP
jgi:hypothetical protein